MTNELAYQFWLKELYCIAQWMEQYSISWVNHIQKEEMRRWYDKGWSPFQTATLQFIGGKWYRWEATETVWKYVAMAPFGSKGIPVMKKL